MTLCKYWIPNGIKYIFFINMRTALVSFDSRELTILPHFVLDLLGY